MTVAFHRSHAVREFSLFFFSLTRLTGQVDNEEKNIFESRFHKTISTEQKNCSTAFISIVTKKPEFHASADS